MNIGVRMINDDVLELCKVALKVLNCNSMWVMRRDAHIFNISVSDQAILKDYIAKEYYLSDPSIQTIADCQDLSLKITLGTNCPEFKKNGFLYDLYKMFDVTEFVSIQTVHQAEHYCFRFFTQNNRFVFMNNILNNMPIIKMFIVNVIERLNKASKQ